MTSIKSKADLAYITQIRREFHQHPELSGQEERTSKRVVEELRKMGIEESQTNIAGHGIVAYLGQNRTGKVVALRADMDALPIHEETGVPFASKHAGVMHACGHDAHTAMLLGAAKMLKDCELELPGRVALVFQPAEEAGPIGGAGPMIETGVFKTTKPDVIFGLHVWPALPVGQIGVKSGFIMGAADRFKVQIQGKGGHASMPHETIDSVLVAVQISQALQTIISRNINPLDSAVITIGKIQAGNRHNIIPDEAVIEGTVRSFKPEVRQLLAERFQQIVTNIAMSMGASVKVDYQFGYPVVENHAAVVKWIQRSAIHLLGQGSLPEIQPSLAAEDFAVYLKHFPGAFFWLGCGFEDESKNYPLHHPKFILDERSLGIGSEMLAEVACQYLHQT